MADDRMTFEEFRDLYKSLGMETKDVMRVTGMSRNALEKWAQAGHVKNSSTAVLFRLARELTEEPNYYSKEAVVALLNRCAEGGSFGFDLDVRNVMIYAPFIEVRNHSIELENLRKKLVTIVSTADAIEDKAKDLFERDKLTGVAWCEDNTSNESECGALSTLSEDDRERYRKRAREELRDDSGSFLVVSNTKEPARR